MLVLLVLLSGCASEPTTDPLAVLRDRTVAPLLSTKAGLPAASALARTLAGSMLANGSWPDIDYADTSHGAHDHWQPVGHLSRLTQLCAPLVSCAMPNSLCNDTRLAGSALRALDFWLRRNPCSENWWFNQIDAPGLLADVLLMLQHGGMLRDSTLSLADVLLRRGGDWWRGWSGYNLVSLAKLQLYRGLLWGRRELVDEGFGAVWSQLRRMPWPAPPPSAQSSARCNSSAVAQAACISSSCITGGGTYIGDGIQVDGSFHQHGAQLLDGAYGVGLTGATLSFLPLAAGLEWEANWTHLEVFASHVLEGQQRMSLFGAVWDWQVCGRGCGTSPALAANTISPSGLRQAAVLYANSSIQARLLEFAAQIESRATVLPDYLSGSWSYYRSDYVLHRRESWAASWKGRSNRTIPSRCVNNDAKLSADTGEGATFVYRKDELGSAHQAIWPVISWQQYPGTTIEQGKLQPCNWEFKYDYQPALVGSVSNGRYTAAAQLLQQNTGMQARRSWLFTDYGVASMVSNMTQTNRSASVLTTVANQALEGTVSVILKTNPEKAIPLGTRCLNGTTFAAETVMSVLHNHTAYLLFAEPSGALIRIDCGPRDGDYFRISTNHQPATKQMFTLSYQHSSDPLQQFGYLVLPNTADLQHTSLQAHQVALSVSSNAHVIANVTSGLGSVLFFSAGNAFLKLSEELPLLSVQSNMPCLLLLSLDEDDLSVSVSSPDQSIATVTLRLAGIDISGASSTCSRSAPDTLEFTLPKEASSGNSTTCRVRFSKVL